MSGEDGVHPVFRELIQVELPVGRLEVEVIFFLVHGLLDDGAVREDEKETGPLVGGEFLKQPGAVLPLLLEAVVLEEAGVHADEGATLVAEAEAVIAVAVQIALQIPFLLGLEVVVAGHVPHGDVLVDPSDQLLIGRPLLFVETVVDHVAGDDDEGGVDAVDRLHGRGQQADAFRHRILFLESQLGIGDLHEEKGPGGRHLPAAEEEKGAENDPFQHVPSVFKSSNIDIFL